MPRFRLRTLLILTAVAPAAIWIMVMAGGGWIRVFGALKQATRDELMNLLSVPAGFVFLTMALLIVATVSRRLPR